MTPWPEPSYNQSPTMQQPNSDPFASFASASPPSMPNQAPALSSEAPPAMPAAGTADPWAAMMAPPAQAPPQEPPAAHAAPAPVTGVQLTPPPATVFADSGNQSPPSPMGDVSVLAQADNAHAAAVAAAAAAHAAPSAAPSISYLTQAGVQPLQPMPQLMPQPMQPDASMQPALAQAAANPFDFGAVASSMPAAPPPAAMPPMAPPTPPTADFAAAAVAQQQQPTASPPLSPVPAQNFAPQQGFADPFGYAFSPMTSPVTSPGTSPNASPTDMVPSVAPNADPFGVAGAPMMPGTQDPGAAAAQAVVPSAALNADPFGVFGSQPAPAPASTDPFGSSTLIPSGATAPAAGGVIDDPFGLFGAPTPIAAPAAVAPTQAAPVQQQTSAPTSPAEEDPWAAAGFGNQASSSTPQSTNQPATHPSLEHSNSISSKQDETPITLDCNNLPSEGEYYEARINARSLGAMFYTARNLEETLLSKMPNNVMEALGPRPVVAYVAEDSAAHNSGIHLGHVILTVNGHDISDPEYCANVIRNCPRPMNLRCYVPPNLELTMNEGGHMVKYDTKDLEAPNNSVEWKRKHVVIGGIVTKPWMMNMFYRKKDYDIAVKEAHSGHKISVKVKQFDLRGARIILKGKDGKPNWVDYPSERNPWYYITILPNKGYPIKISAESMEELEPVYSAVRRFIKKDMESRYQYGMGESFGNGRSRASGGARGNKSGIARNGKKGSGEFNGFGDANPQPQSDGRHQYWR